MKYRWFSIMAYDYRYQSICVTFKQLYRFPCRLPMLWHFVLYVCLFPFRISCVFCASQRSNSKHTTKLYSGELIVLCGKSLKLTAPDKPIDWMRIKMLLRNIEIDFCSKANIWNSFCHILLMLSTCVYSNVEFFWRTNSIYLSLQCV